MTATVNGAGKPRARKAPVKRAAPPARPAIQVPYPPPPAEETLGRRPRSGADEADTPADKVMLPDGFSFEPVRFGPEEKAPDPIRVTLFYGPDGTEYKVWANPTFGTGFEYTSRAQGDGTMPLEVSISGAAFWLLGELLGGDGRAALLRMRALDGERFQKILAICMRIATGPLELPKDAGSA
jgi:hypothetical protein